jgi:hypothetical protein
VRSHRSKITLACVSGIYALVAFSAITFAQTIPQAFQCKATETQAECHTRLKCKPDEELEACQKRLTSQAQQQGNTGNPNNANNQTRDRDANDRGRDRDANDRGRDRRADDRGRDRRTDDRGRDDDADDRGRGRRGRDRGRGRDHDDDGGRSHRQRQARSGSHSFEANKTFGLGLELGEPTGLNGKYFFSDAAAIDFGLGWIYDHYYYGDGAHLYADFLYHPVSLVHASAFELPLYFGGGLRFWSFHYCVARVCDYGGSAIGIRIPVGISFDFNNVPLDIFIQLVPVIDFVNGDYYDRYRDRTHFGVDLSVGIRYWFK